MVTAAWQRIEPQSAVAFALKEGDRLVIRAPEGQQVSDLTAFNQADTGEYLFNGKTFDYEETLDLAEGATLWSNRSRPMLKIARDTNGQNDFLLAPCCSKTFELIYAETDLRPGCLGNLEQALSVYGIARDQIPTAFNVFMNVQYVGSVRTLPPKVTPDDEIEFVAKMDLIVAITACSAGQSNGGSFKPIDYRIDPH